MNSIQKRLIIETLTTIASTFGATPILPAGEENPTVKKERSKKSKAIIKVKSENT